MKVTITIATYNRHDLLDKLLYSLANQTVSYTDYEVIVCDSHSDEPTKKVVETYLLIPGFNLRHLHTDNILAAKRNLGIKKARTPKVVFLDDDCIPDHNFVESYISCLYSNDVNTVFCGSVKYPKSWVEKSNYYRFRDVNHHSSNSREELDFRTIVVMNMGFDRAEFIKSVKCVDEAFVGYGAEDQELGWRLIENGMAIKTCASIITHYEQTSNISNYAIKMHRTARDGMSTLIAINPSVAWALPSSKLLEPDYPNRTNRQRIIYGFLNNFVFKKNFISILELYLNKTDSFKLFYSRNLFRIVMAYHYHAGVKDRDGKLTKDSLESGWF